MSSLWTKKQRAVVDNCFAYVHKKYRFNVKDIDDVKGNYYLRLAKHAPDWANRGLVSWLCYVAKLTFCDELNRSARQLDVTSLEATTSLHLIGYNSDLSFGGFALADKVIDDRSNLAYDQIAELDDLGAKLAELRKSLTPFEREVLDAFTSVVYEGSKSVVNDCAAVMRKSRKSVDNAIMRIRAKARTLGTVGDCEDNRESSLNDRR